MAWSSSCLDYFYIMKLMMAIVMLWIALSSPWVLIVMFKISRACKILSEANTTTHAF